MGGGGGQKSQKNGAPLHLLKINTNFTKNIPSSGYYLTKFDPDFAYSTVVYVFWMQLTNVDLIPRRNIF